MTLSLEQLSARMRQGEDIPLSDTARIALLPGSGWPQQTGVSEVTQVEPLTGSFVELGKEGCVVYSRSGKKLNSIQSGYARPALAAGRNRFVLYNRSGNELRVESRTQNLYTKQLENSIFLCAMADNGNLAVVTEDVSAMAELLIYNSNMEQVLSWSMSSNDGTPLRMAFSPDSRRLAAAAVTAGGGKVTIAADFSPFFGRFRAAGYSLKISQSGRVRTLCHGTITMVGE